MKISLYDLYHNYQKHKLLTASIFSLVFISAILYSVFFIPRFYKASIGIKLPAGIKINEANMSVNILKNAVFVNPIKNPDKIQYEVILTPSADTIRISFYGKNPHTLELFRDTYMNKAVHALSTYFFDVAGAEKSHQLAIINIDHIDSMEIKKINTINIWASLLLAIVSTLSFLFVHIIVWSNTNE